MDSIQSRISKSLKRKCFRFKLFPLLLLVQFAVNYCSTQESDYSRSDDTLLWCTTSDAEHRKCQSWAESVGNELLQAQQLGHSPSFEFVLRCERMADRDQCMNALANQAADLMTLDAGEVFIAGRYHSLVPIASEIYAGQTSAESSGYYAVAVVHKNGRIQKIQDLEGSRSCFPAVGQMAGWVLPLATLLQKKVMPVADCNNMIKTAAQFFNTSCAPSSLIDKHNPSGDNPQSMCSLCSSNCAGNEPYAGFLGAFRCLLQRGEVAFLKHNTVQMALDRLSPSTLAGMPAASSLGSGLSRNQINKFDFALLCPEGGRAELHAYATCNWGHVPAHAVVTVSSVLPDKREKMQRFLLTSAQLFGGLTSMGDFGSGGNFLSSGGYSMGSLGSSSGYINVNPNSFSGYSFSASRSANRTFRLFGDGNFASASYDEPGDLLFSADAIGLQPISAGRQTFKGYLDRQVQAIEQLRTCPVPSARLCITSIAELLKCNAMATAFRAQMLKPQLTCVQTNSSVQCMQSIRAGAADLTMLDAGDVYRGGQAYGLAPIVSERYNLDDSSFFAVAVARQSDKDTDLLHLKGRRSCHSAYGAADGWLIPLNFLLSNNRMRSYGCDSLRAAAQFFQKSCAPGALSPVYARDAWSFGVLCDLCHGSSYRFCSRSHEEPFYGPTGALRCLVEGGGEIAFVRHTTVLENTAGRNPMLWSRNLIPDDFELLCRDGTRARYSEYRRCHLGRVPSNALVTAGDRSPQQVDAYMNLFLLAQELYGSKYSEDYTFKMFVSEAERGIADLIFQDATSSLVAVPPHRRHYLAYLGPSFVHAFKGVDCAWSAANPSSLSVYLILLLPCFSLLVISKIVFKCHL